MNMQNGFFQISRNCSPDEMEWFGEWRIEYGKKVQEKLRITLGQVRRCYEIFKLNSIDTRNEKQYTPYRLEVKRRLFVENEEEIS